jgi:drug/metabolite transporter (DMT)-like permease
MIVKLIDFLRDRLKAVIGICFVVLALLVAWDIIFVDKHHAHTGPEHWPFFWALFGFAACVVIILVSKWFGHFHWFGGKFTIMAPEDFYDK